MRIRTIKPEFYLHETLFELEREVGLPIRLSFTGLWCVADREGRFKWEPRKIGAQILPYDQVDFSVILDHLANSGLVIRYGENYEFGAIPSFLKHQCINIREAKSTIPEPPEDAHARTCVVNNVHIPSGVNIPKPLAETVKARDGNKCLRCKSTEDLTIDHIFPQSIGGTHATANLRTLCRSCNSARPVQGVELIADLALDGLTLDDMQRTCTHVQARVEGKGMEGNKEGNGKDSLSAKADDRESKTIESIWKLFPTWSRSRSSKLQVQKEWAKIKPKPLEADLIAQLEKWAKCHEWTKDSGQYAPGAHLWIRNRKWEDDPAPSPPPAQAGFTPAQSSRHTPEHLAYCKRFNLDPDGADANLKLPVIKF